MPMWEGDEAPQDDSGPTPKERLMHWIQNWPSWDPKDALQNASEAMGLADDWLNVRQLLKPEDLVNPAIDEQSMMTYLSQFPNAKLKAGAPIRPRANPNRVRAYGPGIEPTGPVVGAPANFTVETFSAGKGNVEVVVLNPHGANEPVDVRFNNDKNLTYSVSYIPKMEGSHKVIVKYSGKDIPKSPYSVNVEGHAGDANKVVASGPGLLPKGVCVNRPTYFDITTSDAGKGELEVFILDPADLVPTEVRQIGHDSWRYKYESERLGQHSVNVFYAGEPIPNSPFRVCVGTTPDPKKVRARGRGLQPKGIRVGDDATFNIYTDGAGKGVPVVCIIGPGGVNCNVQMRKVDGTTYEARYIPMKEGRYRIMITFVGHEIPKSPFDVAVGPKIQSNVVAYGVGLRGGIVGYPAAFTVESNGEQGNLKFKVAGPSQVVVSCKDNEDGSCCVRYTPTAPGDYSVLVLINEEYIHNSPFMAKILPKSDFHPENVRSYGPGLQPTGVTIDIPATFTVDTKSAGNAPLDVRVSDCFGTNVPVNIVEQKDGTKKCVYIPKTKFPHTVEVNYGNVPTPDSPYRVRIAANPAKVQVFGPWLEGGVQAFGPGLEGGLRNEPAKFTVETNGAGTEDLFLAIEGPSEVKMTCIDKRDGSSDVEYTPTEPGEYKITIRFAKKHIPGSPFKVLINDVAKPGEVHTT